jgi:hypothetical protein
MGKLAFGIDNEYLVFGIVIRIEMSWSPKVHNISQTLGFIIYNISQIQGGR